VGKFVHLHVHSEFSILDGMARVEDIVKKAKADGQPAIAITDHGRLSGVPEFYSACRKYDVSPIIGQEFYLCLDHSERVRSLDKETGKKESKRYHLVLLARDKRGYEILCELSSTANSPEYYYYKPRIDYDLLEQLGAKARKHLIASTTCTSGHIPELVETGRKKEAVEWLMYMRELFPYMYLELQRHEYGRSEQDRHHNEVQENLNTWLIRKGIKYDIPTVITNDTHYVEPKDHDTHDLLLAIQTAARYQDKNRFAFAGRGYHVKTTDEMRRLWDRDTWRRSQRAIRALVSEVDIRIPEFDNRVWHIPTAPRKDKTLSAAEFMRVECKKGLKRLEEQERLADDIQAYRDRLRYELRIIFGSKFEEEFLIVRDYIRWARRRNIRVGPGRGSMAGVLAAYLMGIVDVDPIRYGLMFERALNPARPSLPDFDVDFQKSRREEVVAYLLDTYNKGEYQSRQVGTFNRLGPRGTIQNILRSLGFTPPECNSASKSLPDSAAITNLKASGELGELLAEENREQLHPIILRGMEAYPQFYEWATTLQDLINGEGKHAAGVVITDSSFNLDKLVPTMMVGRGEGRGKGSIVTQFDMNGLKKVGVVKFDILSLDTLDIIQEVINNIGYDPFRGMLKYEDAEVFATINAGAAYGVFQVEGGASRQVVRDLVVKSFEDVVAVMALGRSGANQFVPQYREGRDNPKYAAKLPDKRLRSIMPRGVILYQEQVMEIGLQIAGMDHHVVDELKEAIKYKKGDVWDELKPIFFEGGNYKGGHCVGALHNGCSQIVANQIWNMIFSYRGYGFNRAHAVSYAMIAYQTAWLKTYHPAQFYAALLTHKDLKERPGVIDEAKKHFGIKFLPPDINSSGVDFTVVGKRKIRYGLAAVKGVGPAACAEILSKRGDVPFTSIEEFLSRIEKRKCNKKVVEQLRRVGALNSIGGLADENREATELELLGTYVTVHPIDKYRKRIDKRVRRDNNLKWFDRPYDKDLWVGGIITSVREITTQNGHKMAFVKVTYDGLGDWEVVVFPTEWEKYKHSLYRTRAVCVYGKFQHERGSVILNALEIPKAAA
jgi:DNA polymerase-3 subunit alpha